jgi:hypothetical protein
MNDLIERLCSGEDVPVPEIITALREQEIINKLHPTKTKLRARIAELEAELESRKDLGELLDKLGEHRYQKARAGDE